MGLCNTKPDSFPFCQELFNLLAQTCKVLPADNGTGLQYKRIREIFGTYRAKFYWIEKEIGSEALGAYKVYVYTHKDALGKKINATQHTLEEETDHIAHLENEIKNLKDQGIDGHEYRIREIETQLMEHQTKRKWGENSPWINREKKTKELEKLKQELIEFRKQLATKEEELKIISQTDSKIIKKQLRYETWLIDKARRNQFILGQVALGTPASSSSDTPTFDGFWRNILLEKGEMTLTDANIQMPVPVYSPTPKFPLKDLKALSDFVLFTIFAKKGSTIHPDYDVREIIDPLFLSDNTYIETKQSILSVGSAEFNDRKQRFENATLHKSKVLNNKVTPLEEFYDNGLLEITVLRRFTQKYENFSNSSGITNVDTFRLDVIIELLKNEYDKLQTEFQQNLKTIVSSYNSLKVQTNASVRQNLQNQITKAETRNDILFPEKKNDNDINKCWKKETFDGDGKVVDNYKVGDVIVPNVLQPPCKQGEIYDFREAYDAAVNLMIKAKKLKLTNSETVTFQNIAKKNRHTSEYQTKFATMIYAERYFEEIRIGLPNQKFKADNLFIVNKSGKEYINCVLMVYDDGKCSVGKKVKYGSMDLVKKN